MTNQETVALIRAWANVKGHAPFSWPTDGADYAQHVRFVAYRNRYWEGGTPEDFRTFALEYADVLSRDPEETPGS